MDGWIIWTPYHPVRMIWGFCLALIISSVVYAALVVCEFARMLCMCFVWMSFHVLFSLLSRSAWNNRWNDDEVGDLHLKFWILTKNKIFAELLEATISNNFLCLFSSSLTNPFFLLFVRKRKCWSSNWIWLSNCLKVIWKSCLTWDEELLNCGVVLENCHEMRLALRSSLNI